MVFRSRLRVALFLGVLLGLIGCSCCGSGSTTTSSTSGGATPTPTPPGHFISISWQASSSPESAKYNVYRSAASGGPYSRVGWGVIGTSFSDTTVQPGATYFYVVTAVTGSNAESVVSPEVKATVPTP
jgi:fibronectin type 3 domain-containing protein